MDTDRLVQINRDLNPISKRPLGCPSKMAGQLAININNMPTELQKKDERSTRNRLEALYIMRQIKVFGY